MSSHREELLAEAAALRRAAARLEALAGEQPDRLDGQVFTPGEGHGILEAMRELPTMTTPEVSALRAQYAGEYGDDYCPMQRAARIATERLQLTRPLAPSIVHKWAKDGLVRTAAPTKPKQGGGKNVSIADTVLAAALNARYGGPGKWTVKRMLGAAA